MVKLSSPDKITELLEDLFCLPGEPYHKRCSDADPATLGPYALQQLPRGLPPGFPFHGPQDLLIDVLHGKVKIGTDNLLRIYQFQQSI